MINAKKASNNVTPVLRIVADEARTDRNLNRERRQELFIYQLIIYISFFIFLGIVAALVLLFIPGIPSEVGTPEVGSEAGGQDPTGMTGLAGTNIGGDADVDRDAYELILFHAMLIQSVLAGLVAGKMSEGSLKSGAKHAFVLLLLGYIAVLLIG
jgi:flagellar protein FlaJ